MEWLFITIQQASTVMEHLPPILALTRSLSVVVTALITAVTTAACCAAICLTGRLGFWGLESDDCIIIEECKLAQTGCDCVWIKGRTASRETNCLCCHLGSLT